MQTINDRYDIYFLEKLWELVPAIYKQEDGLADNPGVLRSLVKIMAGQAAILRRSQDRLWEDEFIDTCDNWAVPYIGELLATRLLSAQNPRGQRTDVAKTIYYRRRAGTLTVLEQLIKDITGWDGKVVEAFRHLARARHGLDSRPSGQAGRITGTLPGGLADLRSASGSELCEGPFDEYFHLPDFRKPSGRNGLYGITKLNFHLFRVVSFELVGVTPFPLGGGRYTFDPTGRATPLFGKNKRPFNEGWEEWHSAFEWELPSPIRCRLLGESAYRILARHIAELSLSDADSQQLRKFIDCYFPDEEAIRTRTDFLPTAKQEKLLELAIVELCGKNQLWPDALSVLNGPGAELFPKEEITAASLGTTTIPATTKDLSVDAEQGIFLFMNSDDENPLCSYHYGFSGPCGAGSYDRVSGGEIPTRHFENGEVDFDLLSDHEVLQFEDSRKYTGVSDIGDIKNYTLQSANRQRPYIEINADWVFSSTGNSDSCLTLDGLWIGSPAGTTVRTIRLQGDFKCITIRYCSLDPGGVTVKGDTIQPVRLIIEGNVDRICIENSILASITISEPAVLDEKLIVTDSIIHSRIAGEKALLVTSGKTDILRSTIFGNIQVHRLYASDTIITGIATAVDNQTGCFRYSAAPSPSWLPRPYESYLFDPGQSSNYWFSSRVFGQPGYGQLSDVAPIILQRGAENGAEMGAFNRLMNPIRLDGLKIKVEEYMPFGLIPAFINETQIINHKPPTWQLQMFPG